MKNTATFVFVSLFSVLSFATPAADQMPLLVDYYNQEQIAVAQIDATKATVRETNVDFELAEVSVNGKAICSDASKKTVCDSEEVIASRELTATDVIQVTVKTGPMANGKGLRVTFEKSKGVKFGQALRIRRDTSRD